MAREVVKRCDICRKETKEIVGKLHLTPAISGRVVHSNYSHHADVGACCMGKVTRLFNFRKRQTAREYQASRRNGDG